jgi:hypothetical protein
MWRLLRAFCCGAACIGIWLGGVGGAQAAGAMAVGACSGTQCKVVMMLKRSCAALAIDGHKPCGPHGYASARGLGQAENVALQSCYKYGGKDCVIRAWACDVKG